MELLLTWFFFFYNWELVSLKKYHFLKRKSMLRGVCVCVCAICMVCAVPKRAFVLLEYSHFPAVRAQLLQKRTYYHVFTSLEIVVFRLQHKEERKETLHGCTLFSAGLLSARYEVGTLSCSC